MFWQFEDVFLYVCLLIYRMEPASITMVRDVQKGRGILSYIFLSEFLLLSVGRIRGGNIDPFKS